jgi:hypothetical protein
MRSPWKILCLTPFNEILSGEFSAPLISHPIYFSFQSRIKPEKISVDPLYPRSINLSALRRTRPKLKPALSPQNIPS